MGSSYDTIARAKRAPNDDPPETMEEAVSSLGAGFLDLLGEDAVLHTQPADLARDLDRRFPGFREWWQASEPWDFQGIASAAWQIAYEASREITYG
jgi:hypothetical protein